jgi:predicted phospho-2-dehydro-3-deoxyheptonate aldolase
MIGKRTRLSHFFGRDQRTLIVPIDQSITSGPIQGLTNIRNTIRGIVDGQPDAVIMQRGPVMAGLWTPGASLIVHLSAGTQLSKDSHIKTGVCDVEDALMLGADAVSVHISLGLGADLDNAALAEFGRVSSSCSRWGMPLLAMMYVYGDRVKGGHTAAHAARIGCDLGADIIKVNYTGCLESFADVVSASYVPVVVAGGEPDSDGLGILRIAEDALSAGAAGVCIGRNVYQHAYPTSMAQALRAIVHDRMSADEAFEAFIRERRIYSDLEVTLVAGHRDRDEEVNDDAFANEGALA